MRKARTALERVLLVYGVLKCFQIAGYSFTTFGGYLSLAELQDYYFKHTLQGSVHLVAVALVIASIAAWDRTFRLVEEWIGYGLIALVSLMCPLVVLLIPFGSRNDTELQNLYLLVIMVHFILVAGIQLGLLGFSLRRWQLEPDMVNA